MAQAPMALLSLEMNAPPSEKKRGDSGLQTEVNNF